MVSALDSGSSGLGSSSGLGHCVVFLGTATLNSHSDSLRSRGTGDRMLGVNLRWTSTPIRRVACNIPSSFKPQKTGISSGSCVSIF